MPTAFSGDETGATRIEHSLLAALIAIAIVGALTSLRRVVFDAAQPHPRPPTVVVSP